jgi:hypothetical protein
VTRRARTIAVLAVIGALAAAGCSSSYDSPGGGQPGLTDPVTTTAPSSAGAGYAGY